MSHYIIEVALWMLLIFLIGCLLGYLLRKLFGAEEKPEIKTSWESEHRPESVRPVAPVVAAPVAEMPEPAAPLRASEVAPEVLAAPIPVTEAASVTSAMSVGRMERPRGLEAAREGKPDELQRISGIGPKNEKILHTLGFFHFDQIAGWTSLQIAWVDDHLKFNGRIGREEWVEQAALLASGKDTKFSPRFGPKRSKPF